MNVNGALISEFSPKRGIKRFNDNDEKCEFISPEKRLKTPLSSPNHSPNRHQISPLTGRVASLRITGSHIVRTLFSEEPSVSSSDLLPLPKLDIPPDEELLRIASILEDPNPFFEKIEFVFTQGILNEGVSLLKDYCSVIQELQGSEISESGNRLLDPHFILKICHLHHLVTINVRVLQEEIDSLFIPQLRVICCLLSKNLIASKEMQQLLVRQDIAIDPGYSLLKRIFVEPKYLSLTGNICPLLSEEEVLHRVLERIESALLQTQDTNERELLSKVKDLALHLKTFVERGEHAGVYSLFHAVKRIESLASILRDRILVRQEMAYLGAFVSTHHEGGIGHCAVVVSSQTIASKNLSRIERRPNQDGASVWIGSKDPLTPIKSRVVYQPLTPNSDRIFRSCLPEGCLPVESAVHAQFNRYVREISDLIPVPEGTTFSRIAPFDRPQEPNE